MNMLTMLRYVSALYEHKHFGRAAQACHISQPALSNAVRALEDELGVAIVRRGRAFEGFTPEGERVLQSAQRIFQETRLLQQDLAAAAEYPQGDLKIGAVPSAMPMAIRFAAMLQKRHPGIQPIVRAMSSPDIETSLGNLSLDLALGYMNRHLNSSVKLDTYEQYQERYFLLRRRATKASTLKANTEITWEAASKMPLCLLTPEMHNRTIIDQAFLDAGVSVKPTMQTDSILTLALSVVDGAIATILPSALVGLVRQWEDFETLQVTSPTVEATIAFMVLNSDRQTHVLQAAVAFMHGPEWMLLAEAPNEIGSVRLD